MTGKQSYEELEQKVTELEKEAVEHKKVKDSLKLFLHSFESSIDGLAMGDTENRFSHVNEAFAKMFGYACEELVGKKIALIYPDDQLPLLEEALKITMEGGWTGELICKKKDGTRFPVSVSSSRVLDDQGNVITHIASHRDITQEKQAVEALRESEEKWRSLVETAPCVIMTVQRDGTIQFLNRPVGNFTPENTIGTKVWDYVPPDHHSVMRKAIEHIFQTGLPIGYEILGAGPEGPTSAWYMTQLGPILKDGQVIAVTMASTDITEIKKVHEELLESEEKYRTLFENSRDAIFITTRKGEFIDFNQSFLDLFGYTEEEIKKSNSIERYAHPNDRVTFKKYVEEKRSVKDFEVTLQKKDGTKIYALMTATLWLAHDGSILGYQGIIRDITKHKQAEEELQESEAQKKGILDASIDRIRLVDTDMRIIWANKTTTRELHMAPEDLRGKFCYQVFVDRDTPCPNCPTKKALTSGTLEHAIMHKHVSKTFEGETHWDNYSIPVKNESGDIESLIQVTRNITEQVRAEKALRKSEEKYRTILESIEEGYYEVDMAGNFTFFNDSICKMFGYRRNELLGMNNREYTDKKNAIKIYKVFNKVYKTGKPKNIVGIEIISKNAGRRNIETSVSLMKDSEGNVTGFRGIFRDVTKHKRAERAMKKREAELASVNKQLIETNRALSVLAKNLDTTQKESEKRVVQKIRSYIIPIIEKLRQDKNIQQYRADFDLLTSYIRDLTSELANGIKIALPLSTTELRVSSLIRNGMSNQEIAKHLYIAEATVKTHRRNIRRKLDLHNSGINLKVYMKSELDQE